jgi:hypothetical protein
MSAPNRELDRKISATKHLFFQIGTPKAQVT